MKLRKTRIKKVTKANGSTEYYPQFRGWFLWNDFYGWDSGLSEITTQWLKTKKEKLTHSKSEAKELIDYYIAQVEYRNACEIESKVMKVEYEDYP